MRSIRILLVLAVMGAIAGIAVPNAKALGFEDSPCSLSDPANPQLKVCKPDAQVGKSYSLQIVGKGGCTPDSVRYDLVGGTSLPPGLSISSSSALISGIPTQGGVYQFWLQVSDIPSWQGGASWCADTKQSQWKFEITVTGGLQIVQRQSVLTPAQVNTPYSLQLTASGASNVTWSVSSGALPAGLTLNPSTGLLSGTPTQAQDSSFQVKATNGTSSDVQTYSLSVVQPLKITAPTATGAEVGVPYHLALAATGGRAPYKWSADGLPSDFTLDPATGVITGTPGAVSTAAVKVTVTDALGLSNTIDVNLPVEAKLAIKKATLPQGKVGGAYSARLGTLGGVGPFKWAVTGLNPLPAGIKLNARTGRLYGVPRHVGTYRFRMEVTDTLGVHSSLSFVLKVTGGAARH